MAFMQILAHGILNKTPINNNKICSAANNGFTLLELMVVIVIVGIMFSYLALSMRGDSPEEAIKKEAQRLDQLIQIALEEAILRGEEYAIVFKPNSYQFAHLTADGWQAITKDRLLRTRELPYDITIELEIEQSNISFSSNDDVEKKIDSNPRCFCYQAVRSHLNSPSTCSSSVLIPATK